MKFTCTQSDLYHHSSLVSKAVPSRPTHPVLANILLVADEETQELKLTGFDLSIGISTRLPAEIKQGGSITIPAKIFNEIISRIDGVLSFSLSDDDENVIKIMTLSGHYEVRGMGADEYPELPTVDGESITLPADVLLKGLRGSIFCASPDETKQVLTGVHIVIEENNIEFAATDGHRLSVVKVEDIECENQVSLTLPAKAMKEVEKMIAGNKALDSVSIKLDESQALFEIGSQVLTCRRLEGQYPVYKQLIPQKFTHNIYADRKNFLASIERIGVLADERNNIIKCSLNHSDQTIALSCDVKEVGTGEEIVKSQVVGKELKEIAFNCKYLIDGFKNLQCEEVNLSMNGATNPVVVAPLGSGNQIYLIMPVQLRN